MIYADYNYYTTEFGGSLVPEASWNFTAGKVSDYLDAVTFGRLENGIPVNFERNVKRCACEMAEYFFSFAESALKSGTNQAGTKTYEQIGAYSVNFGSVSDNISTLLDGSPAGLETLLAQIAMKHLGRTGLLYRGVD